MIQHLIVVVVALSFAIWSTVVNTYHGFLPEEAPPAPEPVLVTITDIPLAQPTVPTAFETVVSEIVKSASSTPPIVATSTPEPEIATLPPGPVEVTPPSVPFTPLPIPVTPPFTPPAVTDYLMEESVEIPVVPEPELVLPEVDEDLSDEALLRGAIVNIICVQSGGLRGASGSGVIVDPRGIIVTVAHIGQNFLLKDYPTKNAGSCYVRTGSPARNAYSAELVYISPSWIEENKTTFLETRPRGTGENDFAFIAITGSLTGASLPGSFPAIPLAASDTEIEVGDRVGTGSYAAEFLTSSEVRSSLYPTIKFADIDDVYTFDRNTVDIFSVAAGSAAQEGSSGGVVMDRDDALIGLITTRTVRPDLSLRTLQAITPDHMRRSFREDMEESLDSYLRDSIPALISGFTDEAEDLKEILFSSIR